MGVSVQLLDPEDYKKNKTLYSYLFLGLLILAFLGTLLPLNPKTIFRTAKVTALKNDSTTVFVRYSFKIGKNSYDNVQHIPFDNIGSVPNKHLYIGKEIEIEVETKDYNNASIVLNTLYEQK